MGFEIKHSGKRCPRCREKPLLRWSENDPTVHFDAHTGRIQSVSLMRYCIACGFKEVGYLRIDAEPTFTEVEEE